MLTLDTLTRFLFAVVPASQFFGQIAGTLDIAFLLILQALITLQMKTYSRKIKFVSYVSVQGEV